MRSAEQIVKAVHAEAAALRRRQARRRLTLAGGSCGILSILLLAVIETCSRLWHTPLSESYAGASLLGDSVGGYVLVAVLAFMAGVGITVFCYRYRRKREKQYSEKIFHPSKEETP